MRGTSRRLGSCISSSPSSSSGTCGQLTLVWKREEVRRRMEEREKWIGVGSAYWCPTSRCERRRTCAHTDGEAIVNCRRHNAVPYVLRNRCYPSLNQSRTLSQPLLILITSMVTKNNRISVKQFATVPAFAGLPAITRSAPSVSGVSSFQGPEDGGVDLNEGCMVTKVIKYTHQLVQFVNAVRGEDPSIVVSRLSSWKCLPAC